MAQVPGHRAISLDDGEPATEPAAMGGAAPERAEPPGRPAGGRRQFLRTGRRAGRAAEPPGFAAGRHAGDGGQDGPAPLGAAEPDSRHAASAVHDTEAREPGHGGVHAARASGQPAPVHSGPDSVPGGRGGRFEPVAGLVPEQRATAVVGRRRRQPSRRPAGERREPDTGAQHSDHYKHGRRQPAVQRHTRRDVAGSATVGRPRPHQAADLPAHSAVRTRPVPVHRRRQRPGPGGLVVQRRHVRRVHGVQPHRVH